MKFQVIVILHLICFGLFCTSCTERDEILDLDDIDTTHNTISDSIYKLEVYLQSDGTPVQGVTVISPDTSLITGVDGYFFVEKDSGSSIFFTFGHPDFEIDSLYHTFLKDTIIYQDLTPINNNITSDYYPILLNYTWEYEYTLIYWLDNMDDPTVRNYIIQREIIYADSLAIVSELHKYGTTTYLLDTTYFDTTYQVTEPFGEEDRIISFHEILPSVWVDTNLVLNKYMEEGLNEGKTNIDFYNPLTFAEYQSDSPISGIMCLYANMIAAGPYYPQDMNVIYLADSIGLVKMKLEYGGNVDSYSYTIELIDFYEN